MLDRETIWLIAYQAALSGLLAAETKEYRFADKQKCAESAGRLADFSLAEYYKRFKS